jgi:hypothetical protein
MHVAGVSSVRACKMYTAGRQSKALRFEMARTDQDQLLVAAKAGRSILPVGLVR